MVRGWYCCVVLRMYGQDESTFLSLSSYGLSLSCRVMIIDLCEIETVPK